jgi:hypothetical protein
MNGPGGQFGLSSVLLLVAILLIGMSEARWCFSRLGKFGRAYSSRWDSSVKKAVACACGGADAGGHVRARQSPLRQSGSAIRDYATRRPSPLTMSGSAKITRTLDVATLSVCQYLELDHASHPALPGDLQEAFSIRRPPVAANERTTG